MLDLLIWLVTLYRTRQVRFSAFNIDDHCDKEEENYDLGLLGPGTHPLRLGDVFTAVQTPRSRKSPKDSTVILELKPFQYTPVCDAAQSSINWR